MLASLPASSLTNALLAALTDRYIALQVDNTQTPPQLVPRLVSLAQILEELVGTGADSLAAGNDPRIENAAQTDGEGNLALTGNSITLGNGKMSASIDASGTLTLTAKSLIVNIPLPTVDPGQAGAWWNNGQIVSISSGAPS